MQANGLAGIWCVFVCDGGGPHVHAQLWWNAQQLRVVVADACYAAGKYHSVSGGGGGGGGGWLNW